MEYSYFYRYKSIDSNFTPPVYDIELLLCGLMTSSREYIHTYTNVLFKWLHSTWNNHACNKWWTLQSNEVKPSELPDMRCDIEKLTEVHLSENNKHPPANQSPPSLWSSCSVCPLIHPASAHSAFLSSVHQREKWCAFLSSTLHILEKLSNSTLILKLIFFSIQRFTTFLTTYLFMSS